MIDLNFEQKEIVDLIEKLSITSKVAQKGRRFSWNRYNGNMTCNVVKDYLNRHLKGNGMEAVGPAFICGYPNEFDLLVVDASAQPGKYTDAYHYESVYAVVELKSHGTYSEDALRKIKEVFDDLVKQYSLKCAYIAVRESGKPKRKGTKNWVEITRNTLAPHKVFVLSDSRTKELYSNQWREFLEFIISGKSP
ncbi:MAG: hypothetical protein QXK18_04540 [Candidatus Bathyarchaeia archaeon]